MQSTGCDATTNDKSTAQDKLCYEAADSIRNDVMRDPGSLFLASSVLYGGLPK
jgi:hypothetical protein